MVPVRMMQATVDKIVRVIAVRNGFVAAIRSVSVAVAVAFFNRATTVRILITHFNHVFVDMIAVRVMQVTVVKIPDVIAVSNRGVTTIRSVLMRVIFVFGLIAVRHETSRSTQENKTLDVNSYLIDHQAVRTGLFRGLSRADSRKTELREKTVAGQVPVKMCEDQQKPT
jgi:hypothetical protein